MVTKRLTGILRGAGEIARGEASIWIVRRAGQPEEPAGDLDTWLANDPRHADAYAESMIVWDEIGPMAQRLRAQPSPPVAANNNRRSWLTMGVAAGVCMIAFWWTTNPTSPAYATGVGEQRVVQLADGSSLTMNTDTRVRIDFDEGERNIILDKGEVLFQVAHDRSRPFVVRAAAQQVTATGTAFVVRRMPSWVEVTLLNGRVQLGPIGAANRALVALAPGERIRRNLDGAVAVVDRPKIEQVIAWCDGLLILDRSSLRDAIAEMNRYQLKPIVLRTQSQGAPLSGVFRTGESRRFARSVAPIYGLKVREMPDAIILEQASATR